MQNHSLVEPVSSGNLIFLFLMSRVWVFMRVCRSTHFFFCFRVDFWTRLWYRHWVKSWQASRWTLDFKVNFNFYNITIGSGRHWAGKILLDFKSQQDFWSIYQHLRKKKNSKRKYETNYNLKVLHLGKNEELSMCVLLFMESNLGLQAHSTFDSFSPQLLLLKSWLLILLIKK